MIPVRDENDSETVPIINYLLIAVNVAVFVYEFILCPSANSFDQEFSCYPIRVVHHFSLAQFATLFTSTFMHVGLGHLAGNMWVLWLFGDNVEDRLGHFNYLIFYLACALAASCAQIVSNPNETIGCVGASGAIAGVTGAYMMLFPHVKVKTWITLLWFVNIPAWLIMSAWFALQCFSAMSPNSEMIGWFAHIGGFMTGIALLYVFKPRKHPRFIDLDGIKIPYSESKLAAEEELLPSNGYSTAIGAAILLAFICVSLALIPKSLPLIPKSLPLIQKPLPLSQPTKTVIAAPNRSHSAPSKRPVKKQHTITKKPEQIDH
jgi:membrane associated rhomboid family serine protease